MCEMKISLEGINSRLNRAEVIITELENTATEITKSGTPEEKRLGKNEQSIQ